RRLMADARAGKVAVAHGRTLDNRAVLPADYLAAMIAAYEGTGFGRQELDGVVLDAAEGALWSRALLDECRESAAASAPARVVVGVDPPASSGGDACGIVVCALGRDGIARVLADASVPRPTPER